MSSIHNFSFIFIKFEQQVIKKQQKNKKRTTLNPSIDFGSPNYKLSFKLFFLVWTNWFYLQNDAM
jgi:hypothetical protein